MNEQNIENQLEITISDQGLSGKVNGINKRNALDLDRADAAEARVRLVLEAEFATSSYFLGLFTPSVKKYGESRFWEHYQIDARENVYGTAKDAIHYASLKGTGL